MSGRLAFRRWLRETLRNTERSGNELRHGYWGDYDYEYDSLLYPFKSTLNPKGSDKSQGNTMGEFLSNRIFKWTFHAIKDTKRILALVSFFLVQGITHYIQAALKGALYISVNILSHLLNLQICDD